MANEVSTEATGLMIYSGNAYTELVRIKNYPDLGSAPETIEVTDLDDKAHRNIAGLEGSDETIEFTCNYYAEDYETIKTLQEGKEEHYFAVYFGGTWDDTEGKYTPTGTNGKFYFSGYPYVHINGGDVGAVREMTVGIVLSSGIQTESLIALNSVKTTSTKKTSE